MFLAHMLKDVLHERKGLRVLDLCAAPGGKSTLIASFLDETSLLVSNEVIRSRASILEENMTRWGYMNTWVTCNDPKDFKKLKGYFDVVVVDAPCSGSGLFRKDEKAIDEWSEANVDLCAERQKRILADVWPSVKEDGVIIYSTCSYSKKENEDMLDWVGAEFDVTSIPVNINNEWSVEATTSESGLVGYRFFPHLVKGEGFFIAAFSKKESSGTIKAPKFKSKQEKVAKEQAEFLIDKKEWLCIQHKDDYVAIEKGHEADHQILSQYLYLRKVGVALGMPSKKEWIPAHDVVLSIHRSEDLPIVEVNKEQALKFLKKEEMSIPELTKGWYVVSYNGHGLGWIKALGNRVNNYLPKHWRIRMNIDNEDWA